MAGGAAAADPPTGAPDHQRRARQLRRTNKLAEALRAIEDGLAAAPKDLGLLYDKASVLDEQQRHIDAYHAYDAYLLAGATGYGRRQALEFVSRLKIALTTFLEITFAGQRADVYFQSKIHGVRCSADRPTCREGVLPGTYNVIAERPGFERWTGQVTVERDRTKTLAIAMVEKRSLLTVRVAQPGAIVTVDGAAHVAPAPIAAGTHQVVVALAGYTDARLEVTAREGKPVELDVSLALAPPPPAPRPPPPPPRPVVDTAPRAPGGWLTTQRKLAIGAGGLGIAAAVTGLVLGRQANRLERDAFAHCPSPASPCEESAVATALNRRGGTRALQANVAFGAAGVAAIGAALMWLTGAPESITVAPHAGAGAATGLDVAVRF